MEDIKVGDIVKTYKSGLYKVLSVRRVWYNTNYYKAQHSGQLPEPYYIEDGNDPRCDKRGNPEGYLELSLHKSHDSNYNPLKKSRISEKTVNTVQKAENYFLKQIEFHAEALKKLKNELK